MRLIYNIHQEKVSGRLWSRQKWSRCCQTASISFLTILSFRSKILSHPNSSLSQPSAFHHYTFPRFILWGKKRRNRVTFFTPPADPGNQISKKYVDLDWRFALFLAIGRDGGSSFQSPCLSPPAGTPERSSFIDSEGMQQQFMFWSALNGSKREALLYPLARK